MPEPEDIDVQMEDDYDEEADSDFDAPSAKDGSLSSSEDEQEPTESADAERPKKRRKLEDAPLPDLGELDSGDEATIREHEKRRRKRKHKNAHDAEASGDESEGWRAQTRGMRVREKEQKKKNRLVSLKSSTIDVDKVWDVMNQPELQPLGMANLTKNEDSSAAVKHSSTIDSHEMDNTNKENVPDYEEEMITIKRTYNFAGETHTEEKLVHRGSAEARLWLSQQNAKAETRDAEGRVVQRPLRKISRFDPNFSNLDAFKAHWAALANGKKGPTGPKLNVVEKSKMDWATHVDTEGLKEELDVHARAKEGYLNRMDFLREVEQRQEDEARSARLR